MALKRDRSSSDDELSDHSSKNIRLATDERYSDSVDSCEENSSGGDSEVYSKDCSVVGSVPKLQTDEDCDVAETKVVIHETENTAVIREVLPKNAPENSDKPLKSLSELKKELRLLMRLHSKNSGDFVTGGILKEAELPNVPLIEIKDYGIMPVPLNKVVYESIKNLCRQSPYGLGEQTLVDTSVRNSFQLEPEKFEIKNDQFVKQISVLIEQNIKPALGLVGARIYGKIYKLLIYEAGGKFGEHRDTEKEDNMFGTLIVQLPSVFSGGDLVVKHNKSSRVYNNDCPGSSTHCMFVAHYASCPHELKEVTSGYRAALVYSLCWDGNGLKPSPYVASTNAVRLCNMLNEFMDCPKVSYLCWGLDYEYSNASVKQGSLKFFKGKDNNVVAGLKNALDYDKIQFGKDKWELFIASANKNVSEYGECGGRSYDGCDGNCGGEWYENEREFGLDEFVSLKDNSEDADDLKLDFNPEKDIINFRRSKKSDGKVKGKSSKDSDEEFWGEKDIGEGCSGPSGNEGATRERWYQKMVLVLWRSDCSLAIKCQSSMSDGVSHVLDLLRNGEVEEGRKGFMYLWSKLGKMESSCGMLTHMLEMCNILKEKEKAGSLLKLLQKFGIASDDMGKLIAEASHIFGNEEQQRHLIKEMIKKTKESDIKHILSYCDSMEWLDPKEVIQLVVGFVLQDPRTHDTGYNISYGHHRSSWSRSSSNRIPATALVLQYMLQKNNFPDTELDELISKIIDNLPDVFPSISLAIDNQNVMVINLLIMRFIALAGEELMPDEPEKSEKFIAVTDIFRAIVVGLSKSAELLESIAMLVNIITAMCNSYCQQMLLKHLTTQTLAQHTNKKSIPECLMNACRARIAHLEGIVGKGRPVVSWIQPNAIVTGYQQVEKFLRGPNQTFTLRGFSGIWDARRWVESHGTDRGCSMKLTTTGIGKNAAVEIVKTMAVYEKQVVVFNKHVAEYRKLVKAVPGHKSVIPPVNKTSSRADKRSSVVTNSATCNVITID